MISVEDFYKYKNKLEYFITNKPFRSRLLFEAISDCDFAYEVLDYLSIFNKNINSQKLTHILKEIREKTDKNYNISRESNEFDNKLKFALRSLAYFYFLESIDEHSAYSDELIGKIKTKYKEDFLRVISKIDKSFLSEDTKSKIKVAEDEYLIKDDLLQQYIILKEWQDSQHSYWVNGYMDYLEKIQLEYTQDTKLNSFDLEQVTLRKRLFEFLDKIRLLDIDTISVISGLYIKKYIIDYVGGKMYGLAILNSIGIEIPYSIVIPTTVNIRKEDLNFLEDKFKFYSVRSSANIEDGEKASFAGMFDTYLNMKYDNLYESILKVRNLSNNTRLKHYIQKNNIQDLKIGVIIQSFKEPQYSGVWIGNTIDSGILEWVTGNGEKLVSGHITPNIEIWDKYQINKTSLKTQNISVCEIMIKYQKLLETNADFEWMILDNKLIMLQYRPVTKIITTKTVTNKSYNKTIVGNPASLGKVKGKVNSINSPSDNIIKNKILVVMSTDPEWIPHLMASKGVITAYGGFLCHTAIICRELGIPCITGVGEEAIKTLLVNMNNSVFMDGNSGIIELI